MTLGSLESCIGCCLRAWEANESLSALHDTEFFCFVAMSESLLFVALIDELGSNVVGAVADVITCGLGSLSSLR